MNGEDVSQPCYCTCLPKRPHPEAARHASSNQASTVGVGIMYRTPSLARPRPPFISVHRANYGPVWIKKASGLLSYPHLHCRSVPSWIMDRVAETSGGHRVPPPCRWRPKSAPRSDRARESGCSAAVGVAWEISRRATPRGSGRCQELGGAATGEGWLVRRRVR